MPPKKNKKPGRNGFWQYVLEVRDKHPNKHMSMEEAKDYASAKWAAMSKEEKKPYEQLANLARDTYNPGKYTTDGLDIDEVERQVKESNDRIQDMKNDINTIMKQACFSGVVQDQVFLIIHINHLIYYPSEDKYFICEIAIAAVSLKNGIEEVFHSIVKPGKLPLGFYGGAHSHSKETHQLMALTQDEPYENNTREIFDKMLKFMRQYSSGHKMPILYADEKTLEMTTKVIQGFCDEFTVQDVIKVYHFQYLFFTLRNASAGKVVWPTDTFSYNEIEKDVYSYTTNISCDYHEVADISVYCSKSIVTRYGYTVCDNCCADLGIQLVAGYHVPGGSRVPNSRTSSRCTDNEYRHTSGTRSDVSSSATYEDNFPALSKTTPSAASVVSFSSMKTDRGRDLPSASNAASRIEQSISSLSVTSGRRDHRNMNFPAHGSKDARNNQ